MSNNSNLNTTEGRSSVLATFLLSENLFEEKEHVFKLLKNSKLFSEFNVLVQGGSFISKELLYSSIPFPHSILEVQTKFTDALVSFNSEHLYRKKRHLISNIVTLGVDAENETLENLKEKYLKLLDSVKNQSIYNPDWNSKEDYEKDKKASNFCISSGVRQYEDDPDVGGFRIGNLHAVVGYAGAGKSAYCLNLSYRSILQGKDVLLITSEILRKTIQYQLLSLHSYVEGDNYNRGDRPIKWSDIMNCKLSKEDEDYVFDKIEPDLKDPTKHGKFMVVETDEISSYSFFNIQDFCKSLPVQPQVILVDYFQRLPLKSIAKNDRTVEQSEVVKNFADVALGKDGHQPRVVVFMAQSNRSGYTDAKTNAGEYDLTAIFETSQIDKDACFVLGIFGSKELKERGKIRISNLKNRLGKRIFEPVEVPVDFRYEAMGDLVKVPENMNTDFDIESIL